MDIMVRFAENLHFQTKIILYIFSPNVDNQVVVGILSGAMKEFSSSEEHDDDE
jgi:hypothetical protein